MSEVRFGAPREANPRQGLKDGGHTILSCSACGEHLVDLWVVKPDAPFEWRVRAQCCYCGDHSFVETVRGKFVQGGYGFEVEDPDPEAMNDCKLRTVVTRVETEGDVVVFHTKRASG